MSWGDWGGYGKASGKDKGWSDWGPYGGGGSPWGVFDDWSGVAWGGAYQWDPSAGGTGNPLEDEEGATEKLYIKNLPPHIDEAWVREAFGEHGANIQSVTVYPPKKKGQPSGASLELSSVMEAIAVKKTFTSASIEGQQIKIWYEAKDDGNATWNWAGWKDLSKEPPKIWKRHPGNSEAFRMLKAVRASQVQPGLCIKNDENCLFIAGLPQDCDEVHLFKLLSPFGAIASHGVTSMKDQYDKCKGFGFVNYVDPWALQIAAIALDGMKLADGSELRCKEKKSSAQVAAERQTAAALTAIDQALVPVVPEPVHNTVTPEVSNMIENINRLAQLGDT